MNNQTTKTDKTDKTMENTQVSNLQQNLMMRSALIQTGIAVSEDIGTYTDNASNRIKLSNVGVITNLVLNVKANVDIGGNSLGVSPKAPWNLIKQIRLIDYDGSDRLNLTGYQLWVLNSVRERRPHQINNNGLSAVSSLPSVPTSVGNGQDIEFVINVPIAYDPKSDLRGAILAQSDIGELQLLITWNDSILNDGDDDGVYNSKGAAGTLTVNSKSVQVNQDYIFPQVIDGKTPMPIVDLATVYELVGNIRISDNLAQNQEKLIEYPNVRSVLAMYFNYTNNGALSNDISRFKVVTNGTHVLSNQSLNMQLARQRSWLNGDLKVGTFFHSHRSQPVQTANYGNYTYSVTPSTAPTGTYHLEKMVESFAVKGASLGGIGQ